MKNYSVLLLLFLAFLCSAIPSGAQQPRFKVLAFYSKNVEPDHVQFAEDALKFFAAMEEAKPTWYTAVPTMHQALLTRAAQNKAVIARHPLRFVRSSSSSLPPQVIGELEAAFNAPVIEAYGMTEASHQMAANPLRGVRKPGASPVSP